MKLIPLDETISVGGQIAPSEVARLTELGFTTIINNRPDGEQPGQPRGSEIEAAAQAAGLADRHIPVAGGLAPDQIRTMAQALEEASGPVVAFCLSGTRSAFLWALARSMLGDDGGTLREKASAAGYDLSPIAGLLGRH